VLGGSIINHAVGNIESTTFKNHIILRILTARFESKRIGTRNLGEQFPGARFSKTIESLATRVANVPTPSGTLIQGKETKKDQETTVGVKAQPISEHEPV
jgi:hypothetical protein